MMKLNSPWLVATVCVLSTGMNGLGQNQSTKVAGAAGTTQSASAPRLTAADLEEMLAPIALYPDTLLANTLAACVYEDDFKAAAKYVAAGGKVDKNTVNDWDASVKIVASFPEVIKLLGNNANWAVAIGQAYVVQSADVMAAVQKLRARAWANGSLKSSPQQTVVTEGKVIVIEPANPQIIYVPQYNPTVVYVEKTSSNDAAAAGIIGFGLGVATGLIIANNMDCNWYGGCVGWGHGGWGHNDYNHSNNININGDVNIGGGNTVNNIGNNNNIGNTVGSGNRPAQGGSQWKPNQNKMNPAATSGAALGNYKGVGSANGAANANVPGRTAGSKPISAGGQPPAAQPRPSTGNTARPAAPAPRPSAPAGGAATRPTSPAAKPSTPAARPSTPAARPSTPAARPSTPAARPSTPSASPRSSGFSPSGGSRSSGGGSRGGGGGSRGGGGGRR